MTKFMLKKFIQTALLLVVLCTTATTYAQIGQSPEGIQFQALATDANGHPAAGRVIYVKDAIVAKTATGTIVYSETFKVTASSAGIFTIVLGKGTYASGVRSIANIDWANGPFFLNLKIAVEPSVPNASWNVNNEYVDLGTSQFWSTPYALYAGNVKGMDTKLNIVDTAAMLKPYFTSINLKANIESPTFTGTVSGITKAMVGLGNVDNTADIDKPVSSATQAALDLKVDKVTGKALSTNDYTTAEKTKLAAITGTNTGDQDLSALATITALVLKANTSDVTSSLATKVDKVTGKELSTNDYTTAEKTKLAAITGTNTGDQINITGNAATATKLATARKINGVDFDGSGDITVTSSADAGTLTGTTLKSTVTNSSLTSVGTLTNLTVTNPITGSVTGNAATATKLATARKINGVDFDGSGDITVTSSADAGTLTGTTLKSTVTNSSLTSVGTLTNLTVTNPITGSVTGNAATATKLAAPKNINGVAFDGSADITIAAAASTLSGTVQVVSGGTGTSTITGLVKGNGTNAMSAAISGTDYLAPTGSAAALTNFPTLNQNTTGNAATATKLAAPKNINGVAFDGSADITIAAAASTLSGTVQVANGGTGLTTAGLTGQVLTTVSSGTLSWTTPSTTATAYSGTLPVANGGTGSATQNFVDLSNNQTVNGYKSFSTNINANGIQIGKPSSGSQNTMLGEAVFAYASPGNNNTALGFMALTSLAGGDDNTAVGTNAIRQGGTANGSRNTAVGSAALANGGQSNDNVAIGSYAMPSSVTGSSNVALGSSALYSSTTANYNVGIGYETLKNTTTGGSNTAIGKGAMLSNISGDVNTAIGESALISNTNGRYNTSIGVQSQEQNTTGQSNTAIGVAAIDRNTAGSNNAVLGAFAGRYIADNATFNTAINNSVLIGANAKPLANNANNEIVIGYNAIGNGSNTIQLGNTSITNVKTSGTITAGTVTYPNAHNSTTGQVLTINNTGTATWAAVPTSGVPYTGATGSVNLGAYDLTVNGITIGKGSGAESTKVGNGALASNSAYGNTAFGSQALNRSNAIYNNAFGFQALSSNTTGSMNTAIGSQALSANVDGIYNGAFGSNALGNNISGNYNLALGSSALVSNISAWFNVAVGQESLVLTTGNNNTALGFGAGNSNTTGTNNTLIGYDSDVAAVGLTNATAIGAGATVAASNSIQLGNNSITNVNTSGTITAAALSVSGNVAVNTNKFNVTAANGNTSVAGTLDVTGATTLSSATVNGKVIAGASSAASASAVLEANSTTQGFLPPRMTFSQRNAISSPVAGLVVWCSNCGPNGELQVFNGTAWTNMIGGTASVGPYYTIGQAALGGKIAYILQPGDPGYDANVNHGLIAAVSDQGTAQWGCLNTPIAGEQGEAIGTGNQNTIDIIAGCTTADIAARLCGDLVQGGYSDWYLPSLNELNKLFDNRVAIGGFSQDIYWSSREDERPGYSHLYAWYHDFRDDRGGAMTISTKSTTYRVRAIRAF